MRDPAGQGTRCHHCGTLVIERDWYQLGAWRLTGDGRCANCDTPLAGVFDGPPGNLGTQAAAGTDHKSVTSTGRNAPDVRPDNCRLFSFE